MFVNTSACRRTKGRKEVMKKNLARHWISPAPITFFVPFMLPVV